MPIGVVGENVTIQRCIIDKKVIIGRNAFLGYGNDFTPNKDKPDLLSTGITVVEKNPPITFNTINGNLQLINLNFNSMNNTN